MKNSPALLGMLAIAACCTSVLKASTGPPPIDTAALQAYAHGNGTISGSVRFDGAVQAVCAPDIPYVAWYVEEKKHRDAGEYDSQLIPYTHRASVAKDRTFTCQGLARGRYLVWVVAYTRGFAESTIVSRQPDDPLSGQMSPYEVRTVAVGGSDPAQTFVGPEHVLVPETGTANVTL